MAIRVTQQYVDVFGPVDGKLRVSRQYVEVLHDASTTNHNESASSTLNFVQSAGKETPASASSTLVLTSNASGTTDAIIYASATSNLGLYHTWFEFNYFEDRQVPESDLGLSHAASAFGYLTAAHDMGLTHSVDVRGPIHVSVEQMLNLSDSPHSLNKYVYASNALGLSHRGQIPLPTQHVSHTLSFTQIGYMSFIVQALNLTHEAKAGRSPGVQHQYLNLTQTATPGGTFRRTIVQDLGIGQALTYFEDSPCNRKNYTPFMGEGVDTAPEAPAASLTAPQFDTSPGSSDRFLLYWPARGARTTTVSIRAPEFGNRDRNAYSRVSRETRGGRLVVYADPTWPQVRTMVVTIVGLLKSEVTEYQALVYAHLGQLIGITDWNGREWEGVITDPQQPAVQDGKKRWTITFQFEGEIIDGYSTGHSLGLSQDTATSKDPGANSDLGLTHEVGGAMPNPEMAPPTHSLGFTQSASATVV